MEWVKQSDAPDQSPIRSERERDEREKEREREIKREREINRERSNTPLLNHCHGLSHSSHCNPQPQGLHPPIILNKERDKKRERKRERKRKERGEEEREKERQKERAKERQKEREKEIWCISTRYGLDPLQTPSCPR